MCSKALFVVSIHLLLLFCDVESCCFDPPSDNECEYEGWVFAPGASFKAPAPHCEDCTCTAGILSCDGYGKKAGVPSIAGCVLLDDDSTCDLQFVDSTDETRPCGNGNDV
ncbi:uncharacterized protein LOC123556412 isoform X2 [Mercenaria mercenaria]|uniref:uncharacterized protein LOC123556412 isoform X2 n=1 Tax=Mercenaria mercenaria TaxID=6596 RepID=UPI00234F8959|nr:uncharacterized protein LOC123556412 isoform X2 [Mercenaria mercenaria]